VWAVGDTYTFKGVSENTGDAFILLEVGIPPQSSPPPHLHHREDEAYYVLEGEMEVMDGDRTFVAGAGSFVFLPRGTLHRFKNIGAQTAKMLIMAIPAGLEKFIREVGQPAQEGQTAPPLGPDEVERTLAAVPKYGMEGQ
jgi:mannose-6-phosphate isomerase-like protein (cupin superfamily)